MTGLEIVVAGVLAVVAVSAGVAVFVVGSMARATYALAVSFVAVGGELVLLALPYLGMITVLMMVMEMAVMAVFMVMFMMNPAGLMPMTMVHNVKGALVLAIGTFVSLAGGVFLVPWPPSRGAPPTDATHVLGESIMGQKMFVMMVVSAVLFATMVAGMVLAVPRGRYGGDGEDEP